MDTDTAVDTDMEATVTDVSMVDMAADMDMAVMVVMDVSMVAMEDTDTARGPPRLRPMLSPDTDTTAVDTDMADMVVTDVSMVDMEDTDMARGPLRLSLDMVTTAVAMEDMVATDMDVDTDMVDTADTMDKSKSNGFNLHSCTATFILVLKLSLVLP